MKDFWRDHFNAERAIKRTAMSAGIPRARAAQLAQQLACRPLRHHEAARALAAAITNVRARKDSDEP